MFAQQYHSRLINDLSRALQDIITVLAITVNVMLLRIVFTSHRRDVGSYRYLIASFAVSDLIYTSIHWLVYPIPEMYGNAFVMTGHGLFGSRLGASIYCGVYSQASPILVAHFLYRSINIRHPSFLSNPAFFFSLMFGATVSVNFVGFSVMYYAFRPDAETLTKIGPLFSGNSSSPVIHHSETAREHIQALYWSGDTYSRPRWGALIGALLAMSMIVVSYSIIILCAYLINKYLKMHTALSKKTMSLHHQLYRSLLCQAVYPLITTYSPLTICMILPVFGINLNLISISCPPMCISHPLVDALVLIFCMTDYRRMFILYIGLSRCARERRITISVSRDHSSNI